MKRNKNKPKSLIQNYQKSHRHHRSNNRNNTTYTNNNINIYIARKILKEDQGPLFYEQLRYGKMEKYLDYTNLDQCV